MVRRLRWFGRRSHVSRGLRLLVSTLSLPMLLASASRAEVILIHNHCGSLHVHFFSNGHTHDWHHEHERDHEAVPCLCDSTASDASEHAADTQAPQGLLIHVQELPRPGTAPPTVTSPKPNGFELVPASIWLVQVSVQTADDERPPSRGCDDTGPLITSRVCAILLANHALLL